MSLRNKTFGLLPGVGGLLPEHVDAQIAAQATIRSWSSLRRACRKRGARMPWLAYRDGPARSPAHHLQAFARIDLSRDFADIPVQPSAMSSFEPRCDGVQGATSAVGLCRL